jgi:quinolinate synthase
MELPTEYRDLPEEDAFARITSAKTALGDDLVILGHHYQREEVINFADFRGDSLELSRRAAEQKEAKYIVFCGVDFMAETAAMLCEPYQTVILPPGEARCPMAGMATADEALQAWEMLIALWGDDLLPITYQNSSAQVKAFCGKRGGAVCTSANAEPVLRWALAQKGHAIFFPDEHLGRNSALAIGVPLEAIALWNPGDPQSSLEGAEVATMVVWKGYCHVHTSFTVEHVLAVREQYEDITVIVHPECPMEVVEAADQSGSTSLILRSVEAAASGARLAIGTEINMVARMAREHPDKTIIPLARSLCGAMYRTAPQHLCWVLEELVAGRVVNPIAVSPEIAHWANLALEQMLAIG